MQRSLLTVFTLTACALADAADNGEPVLDLVELSAFTVYAGSQLQAAAPSAQLSERMAREARVDMQTRGGSRYQTDISVRGGIFEGTGVKVGGLALVDPQTGHYFSEIPLDPAFFTTARLLTGVENGVYGFNSTAGSIDWEWAPLVSGGSAHARVGSDDWVGGGARVAGKAGSAVGYEVAVLTESGDGSLPNGDFDLQRVSGRVEWRAGKGLLRLFSGRVEKFYGWPNLYTGGAYGPLNETDAYTVDLIGWQYELQGTGRADWSHQVGGYWRRLEDDYEFRREKPNAFFEHLTEVASLQGAGGIGLEQWEFAYTWAVLKDEVRRSTSLVNGRFREREYGKAAAIGRYRLAAPWGEWIPYGGFAIDTTDRDSTVGLPQAGIRTGSADRLTAWDAYVEYSESSRVPGYTALNSAPNGLFGGNRDLGRELAETIEAGLSLRRTPMSGQVAVFRRRDSDLVDWVYTAGSPNARRAAAVDALVHGFESSLRWDGEATGVEIGYSYLDKDPSYASPGVDASFYVLNYARHRLLVSAERQLGAGLFARVEGEYRRHPDNLLRSGGSTGLVINVELSWQQLPGSGWAVVARVENATGEDFQVLPGTPAPGREGHLTISYAW